jgi:N4-gp56 family major capsid protein
MPLLDDRNINDQGIDADGVYYANGNMYGSSKDISTITGKLPVIGENGGRYNRVGFTRNVIEGTIHELGYFFEITEDAMQFDSQSDLLQHMHREAMRGASEIVEDVMQLELINGAGIDYYCGGATTNATMDNDGTTPCELTYKDLLKLRQTLVDNKVPKTYKMFTGSQNTDTRTVAGGWTIYCQPELRTTLMTMLDLFGNPAFIPVEKYAAGGNIVENEIGRILEFRFVEVQEMLRWDNAGAAVSNNDATYISDGTNYTVFPLLIIGEDSFVNINFRGGKNNYRIYQQMPGQGAANADDPFGKHGWWSIQWWYGTMITRPDRLICIHTLAKA